MTVLGPKLRTPRSGVGEIQFAVTLDYSRSQDLRYGLLTWAL